MLKTARSIRIARGKKYEEFSPKTDDRTTIMTKVMGPSGNLRAPTYRVNDQYIVGFNPDLYEDLVK